ncbi:hypothetical protein ES702_00463 [subsurface metagenome]
MSTGPLRIYKDDLDKLKLAAASSGKDEKDILREMLNKVPLEVFEELKTLASARAPTRRRKTEAIVAETPPSGVTNIGNRLKAVIADAVETKVYLKTLGINLGDEPKQPAYPYWGQPGQYPPGQHPQMPQQPPKKDIMTVVAELKALESLDKQTSDPEIKNMLKELKDAQVKQLSGQGTQQPSGRERMRELMEMMTFYKMAGQPEEANKIQDVLRAEMSKVTERLHETELKMQDQQAETRHQDLLRQINEIRTAPTEFDQITRMSQLSEKDPAIRAFMHKRLGIEDKGDPLTPEKLGKYLENIQVPVGKIAKMIWGYVQQQKGEAKPPPPTTPPPGQAEIREISPEALAKLPEQHLPPETTTELPPAPPPAQKEAPAEPALIPTTPTVEQRKETARKMLLEGTDVNLITKATKLSGQQIRGMKGALVKQGKIKIEPKTPKPEKREQKEEKKTEG